MKNKVHLGEKIRVIRKLRSMTQELLGNKVGMTRSGISHIEVTGKVHPDTLESILKALTISKDDLLSFDHKSILMREPNAKSDYRKAELESLKTKIESQEKEIHKLNAQVVKLQNKLIAVLENAGRK